MGFLGVLPFQNSVEIPGLFYPCHVATPSYPPTLDHVNIMWSSLCNNFILCSNFFFLIVRLQTFVECAVDWTCISFDMYSRSIELLKVLVFCDVALSACYKHSSFRKGGNPWLAERLSASRGLRCIVELESKLPEWHSLPQTMGTVQCDVWQHIIQVWNYACDNTHRPCSLD